MNNNTKNTMDNKNWQQNVAKFRQVISNNSNKVSQHNVAEKQQTVIKMWCFFMLKILIALIPLAT